MLVVQAARRAGEADPGFPAENGEGGRFRRRRQFQYQRAVKKKISRRPAG
jgi:hypothetical protein